MKKIVVIGSTGSIGRQVLEVVKNLPGKFKVVGLGAGKNWRLMWEQIREFRPSAVALNGEAEVNNLSSLIAVSRGPELFAGRRGMEKLAVLPEADLVVVAVTGAAGIYPTYAAISAGKNIALANKETLVAAGHLVMDLAARKNVAVLPVDSEHSAIWQCLNGQDISTVNKLILTASGGPFRELTNKEIENVTVEMALHHPNWNMGKKITIDSATLMNKGLEVIEAKWLFGVDYTKIEVVIHPQSIIHSAVEFLDGSVIAQMGLPDMRLPIQYALTHPQRFVSSLPRLKFTELQQLTFIKADTAKFPSLRLAYEAGRAGGTMPAVLNAANEVAVDAFLKGKIGFNVIPAVVSRVMEMHQSISMPDLDEIMDADRWSREAGEKIIKKLY
ncbi:MAG: 1-deoxy-D-xylulose 5-phosphate reductoisomerase [Pelotomaculum thermopropionicum]|uniref:1-deoxy-D-xylulose 5-phosphate reductoisomerase n=1 Tax=Pelotomaculum thermopropionicum TaxID=110500 RepID=A0A101HSH1_9FIRM|nr:MAG: 1-deoxy-D-xylulose 5-phosphate reductoisomerase [Pelotomaculum thermopropionicum]